MIDGVVMGTRVALPTGLGPAAIEIRRGTIAAVHAGHEAIGGDWHGPVVDAGDTVVMPGLVDTHVHVNDPGRGDWEGFTSATRAAAAGGVTSLADMPLNSIPATTSVAGLDDKIAVAEPASHIDVGFVGGLVPGNLEELPRLWAAGVVAFKCFLVDSGVPEFPPVDLATLRTALPVLAELDAPLFVHAELPGPIATAARALERASRAERRRYDTYLASRPAKAEDDAVELLVSLAGEFGARVHVVHLSSAGALASIRRARQSALSFSVETCPHYLALCAEDIVDGATECKCAPPIRERDNRELLWQGLADGEIDLVVSDHSPSPPDLKAFDEGDFESAWGGVSSLSLTLPVVWSEARARGFTVDDVRTWMCTRPAELAGWSGRKGALVAGADCDLVFWKPEERFTVAAGDLPFRHKHSPYVGRELHGVVQATWVRGVPVFERGHARDTAAGRLLKR